MFEHRLTRITALALVVGAVAAPGASAGPADMAVPAAVPTEQRQDLRNPDQRAGSSTSSLAGTISERPSQDLRSPDAVDAAAGRGTFSAPDVVVVRSAEPQPQPVADGIDWGDVGIGAGSLAGITLIALGGALVVVHRRHAGHALRS